MKLRSTQKHNVIYEISNEENLNRWRDKEDQLQMLLTGSDFEQVTNHHQTNQVGIRKNLFFSEIFVLKTVCEINPSER